MPTSDSSSRRPSSADSAAKTRPRAQASRLAPVPGLPFLGQDAHVYLVPVLAVAEDRLARPPLLDEPALLIRAQGTRVEFEDREGNAMECQPHEGVLEHQFRRLGPVAVPPSVCLLYTSPSPRDRT